MKRAEKLKKQIRKIIDSGRKPSATLLAEQLSWPQQDVHRCLNTLEKKEEVKSYTKKYGGRKIRFVALKR